MLPDRVLQDIAKTAGLHPRSIALYWRRAKTHFLSTGNWSFPFGKKGNKRPNVYDAEGLSAAIEAVPFEQRGTQRDLAGAIGVSKTTIDRLRKKKSGGIKPTTVSMHPMLTEEHRVARFSYAMDRVETLPNGIKVYIAAFNESMLAKSGLMSTRLLIEST